MRGQTQMVLVPVTVLVPELVPVLVLVLVLVLLLLLRPRLHLLTRSMHPRHLMWVVMTLHRHLHPLKSR